MIADRLPTIALIVLTVSTLLILLSQNWRWSILALAFQYAAIFLLTLEVWPIGMAVAMLVAGWMAGAVLGASGPGRHLFEQSLQKNSAFLLRLLLAVLVWVLVFSLTPAIASLLPVSSTLINGAMLLIGMGLVQLGVTTRPMRVILGLLTVLGGFELVYAVVENSVLVAGLLAVVTIGLAFVGAYLFDLLSQTGEPV